MKTTVRDSNTTEIRATLSHEEFELILGEAVLRNMGRRVPDTAFKIHVGELRNNRTGSIAPVEFVIDVVVTIDNEKLPKGTTS